MRFVKAIVGGVAILILLFVAVAMLLPREVVVARSIVVDAPPAAVFPLVDSHRRFNDWSPWFELDPDARYTFSGPDRGVGAVMEWASTHPNVGTGRSEIVLVQADRLVRMELEFGAGATTSDILLDPVNGSTRVTWSFHADFGFNPVMRWVGLMFDSMVGPDYERGLARLKALAEKGAA